MFGRSCHAGPMAISIVFETHSLTEDNEHGRATGWLPGRLSERGQVLARELGDRRRDDGIEAVFCSDLARAIETSMIAFGDTSIPGFFDWRLRECDYGERNGMPAAEMHEQRASFLDRSYPGGESWSRAVDRVSGVLRDLPTRWDGARVLIIGHVATRWALDCQLGGRTLEELASEDFGWQEGWEYSLPT